MKFLDEMIEEVELDQRAAHSTASVVVGGRIQERSEDAELPALDRHGWRRSVAQCVSTWMPDEGSGQSTSMRHRLIARATGNSRFGSGKFPPPFSEKFPFSKTQLLHLLVAKQFLKRFKRKHTRSIARMFSFFEPIFQIFLNYSSRISDTSNRVLEYSIRPSSAP